LDPAFSQTFFHISSYVSKLTPCGDIEPEFFSV
jgi:hypothetical protein